MDNFSLVIMFGYRKIEKENKMVGMFYFQYLSQGPCYNSALHLCVCAHSSCPR